jgi:hypothetical protein
VSPHTTIATTMMAGMTIITIIHMMTLYPHAHLFAAA